MPIDYVITIRGHLDDHWSAWFDGLTITNGINGEATLTRQLTDQASLNGVLIKIRDLGLLLIAIMPADATADGLTGTQCDERAPHEVDDGRLGRAHQHR